MLAKPLSIALAMAACSTIYAQVLCVNCYDQNAPVNTGGLDMIVNGSFEVTDCALGDYFCPASDLYNCDLESWTCSGGGTGTYAQLYNDAMSTIPDGTVAVYLGSSFCDLCSIGSDTSCIQMQGCVVNGIPVDHPSNTPEYGGTTGVSLSQTVTGLISGHEYILEFWAGGEDFEVFPQNGVFAVDVGFGNMFLRCKPTAPGDVGTRYEIVFAATSSTHTITFTNWGHIISTATEVIIDDVRLVTLPETSPCLGTQVADLTAVPERIRIVNDRIEVNASGWRAAELTLFDVTGRPVMIRTVSGMEGISIAHLPAGIVTYELCGNGYERQIGRLVKL